MVDLARNWCKLMRLKPLLLGIISFILSMDIVLAATNYVPQILRDMLKAVFITLPKEAQAGTEAFVYYSKFLVFIAIYAIFFFGTNKLFKDSRRIAGVVAFIAALISTILIPKAFLLFLFGEYSAVVSILLGLVPVLIGLYLRHKISAEHKAMRSIIMLLVAVLAIIFGSYMIGFAGTVSGTDAELYGQVGQWASLGGLFGLIAAFVGFAGAFGGAGSTESTPHGSTGGNDVVSKAERDAAKEEKKAEKEEKRALGFTQKEQAYTKELMDTDIKNLESDEHVLAFLNKIRDYVDYYMRYKTGSVIKSGEIPRRAAIARQKLEELFNYEVGKDRQDKSKEIDARVTVLIQRIRKLVTEAGTDENKQKDILRALGKSWFLSRKARNLASENLQAKTVVSFVANLEKKRKDLSQMRSDADHALFRKKLTTAIESLAKVKPQERMLTVPLVNLRFWFRYTDLAYGSLSDAIKTLHNLIELDKQIVQIDEEMIKYSNSLDAIEQAAVSP